MTSLPILALLPFAAAVLLAAVPNRSKPAAAWIAGLTALAGCALLASLAPAVFGGQVPAWSVPWMPGLGMDFGFRLDGLAWMDGSFIMSSRGERIDFTGDLAAIRWLREHAEHNNVILEASIGAYRGNGSRIAAGTGLPTVLGWDHHEQQQRYAPAIEQRLRDVRLLYTTSDVDTKRRLLRTYRVRYVIVGGVERLWRIEPPFTGATRPDEPYASAAGLDAFDEMVGTDLRVAFRSGNTTIYEVVPFPRLSPAARA